MISILEVVFFPADTTYGITDALPGFLFCVSVFVLPAALLAAAALWIGSRVRGPSTARGRSLRISPNNRKADPCGSKINRRRSLRIGNNRKADPCGSASALRRLR